MMFLFWIYENMTRDFYPGPNFPVMFFNYNTQSCQTSVGHLWERNQMELWAGYSAEVFVLLFYNIEAQWMESGLKKDSLMSKWKQISTNENIKHNNCYIHPLHVTI